MPGRALLAFRVCIFIAFALSAYLAWISLSDQSVPGCGPQSSCNQVLKSRWAYWFGIPISLPATALYLMILVGSLRLSETNLPATRLKTWRWILPGILVVAGASLWFLGLQFFALRRICPFCLITDLSGLAASGIALFNLPVSGVPGKTHRKKTVTSDSWPPGLAVKLSSIGAVIVAVLIGGQLLHRPKQYVVKRVEVGTNASSQVARVDGVPTNQAATNQVVQKVTPKVESHVVVSNQVEVFNGRFRLSLNEVPVMGPTNAPNAIVLLFDYTCLMCRQLHGALADVRDAFGNQLAVLSLPVPLEPGCNRTITQRLPDHTNACDLARLGLAVWKISPEKFSVFDKWMFMPGPPPPLEQAREFAGNLVGTNQLVAALADESIEAQIRRNVDIFVVSFLQGNNSLPQVISGNKVGSGAFRDTNDVFMLMEQLIGLKKPEK